MFKIKYILVPAWMWLVTVPLGILTAYNLYRQEINPNAPPGVIWLDKISWEIWLLIFLLVVAIIIISGMWRYIKDSEKKTRNESVINSNSGNEGVSLTAAEINNSTVTQQIIRQSDEKEPPNIVVRLLDEKGLLSQKITLNLEPIPARPDVEELTTQKRGELLKKNATAIARELENYKNLIGGKGPASPLFVDIVAMETESRNSYPRRIETYLSEYSDYLNELYDASILEDRFRMIRPVLENRSRFPASLITIELSMPDTFSFPSSNLDRMKNMRRVLRREYIPPEPKEPSLIEYPGAHSDFWERPASRKTGIFTGNLDVYTQQGVTIIRYLLDNLVQNLPPQNLPPIPVWLKEINQSTTWNIPIKIYAKELPKPIESLVEIEIIILPSYKKTDSDE